MISVHEAMQKLKKHVRFPEKEMVQLEQAIGRTLADDVLAVEPAPRYTNSAMDGYAVKWEDIKGVQEQKEVILSVIGESQAGIPFEGKIENGEAVMISTGALMPDDVDTVVPVEEVEKDGASIRILKVKKKGNHVRYEGEEIRPGDILVKSGTVLYPEHIAVLASQGIKEVSVYTLPSVALFTTGTEVKPYSEKIEYYQLRDSNLIMLQTAIHLAKGKLLVARHIADDLDQTIRILSEWVDKVDIIILTGGVSMGPHDHVKEAARQLGFETVFWKVNQKPGKPFFFAVKGKTLLFGLPGNPVSAFMGYVHYIHPILDYLHTGKWIRKKVEGFLHKPFQAKGKRIRMVRVKFININQSAPVVHVLERQGSHMLTSISEADGYILAEPGEEYTVNEKINVYLFPWRNEYGIR